MAFTERSGIETQQVDVSPYPIEKIEGVKFTGAKNEIVVVSPKAKFISRISIHSLRALYDAQHPDRFIFPHLPIDPKVSASFISSDEEVDKKFLELTTAKEEFDKAKQVFSHVTYVQNTRGFDNSMVVTTTTGAHVVVDNPAAAFSEHINKQIEDINKELINTANSHLSDPDLKAAQQVLKSIVTIANVDADSDTTTFLNKEKTAEMLGAGNTVYGISEVYLCEKISELRKKEPDISLEIATKATMLELVLASAVDMEEKVDEEGEKINDIVYALLPFDPTSSDLLSCIKQYSDYLPNLYILITAINPANANNKRRFLGK